MPRCFPSLRCFRWIAHRVPHFSRVLCARSGDSGQQIQRLSGRSRVNIIQRRLFCSEAAMRTLWLFLAPLLLAILLISCGSNSNKLQSISVTPANADAKDYANGQVQFTASGMYSNGKQVKPLSVLWSAGPPWLMEPWAIEVNSDGTASCVSAPAGTYSVWAGAPTNADTPLSGMNQSTPQVSGTALLTCP